MSFSITWSQNPFIFNAEFLSKPVYWMFMITSFPWSLYLSGRRGMFELGRTVNEEPRVKHKSALAPYSYPLVSSYLGSFYPKYMIESCNYPPQFSHVRPVMWYLFSPGLKNFYVFFIARKSLRYFLWHLIQNYKFRFPWS